MAFFSSLKLTIFLLITLALVSIIGTVVPQNQLREEYLRYYDQSTYATLKSLGLLDMYHSWWFVLILGLLAVNLIACSWKHFPRAWYYFSHPTRVLDKTLEKGTKLVWRGMVSVAGEIEPPAVLTRLKELWPAVWRVEVSDGENGREYHFSAEKGRWSRLGVYFVHLSVLVIFAGGIIGSLYGVKGFVNIPEGEKIDTFYTYGDKQTPIKLGFEVECRKFAVEFYDTGRPKEYSSDLAIYERGKLVREKVIEVNHPLSYNGYSFYQSSYGSYGGEVELELHLASGPVLPLQLEIGRPLRLPENWGWIEAVKFEKNYMRMGPAVLVLRQGGADQRPWQTWSFLNYPAAAREHNRNGEYVMFKNYRERYYTGLQVNRDPGVWVVWIGCLMMILGLYVAFFMSHRRLWLRLEPEEGKTRRWRVVLAANANKNQPAFAREFEQAAGKIKTWKNI
jgi:cytochrome c biogenesis protein